MDNIKIELNYSLRAHILNPVNITILTDVFEDRFEIHTLDPMEIFAAKANALISRAAARDLYDFNNMIYYGLFDLSQEEMFRKCIIFYNTISQEAFEQKEYRPELLFTDSSVLENIKEHPMALWKCKPQMK